MKILIAYATTEGQTRKVARFAADRLVAAGDAVELVNLADAEGLDAARFDAAILAGSIHGGRYQPALAAFARDAARTLAARPGLFLSVSLSAADTDPEERAAIAQIAVAFTEETGWRPGEIAHVAGAFRFGEYDYFKRWMMRRIARDRGVAATGDEVEMTDWDGLGATLDGWRAGAG